MSAVPLSEILLSPDDYLAFEEQAEERHEYVHGVIYAMAGGSEEHDLICGDLNAALIQRLGSGPCRAFTSNMKLLVDPQRRGRFYYPDAMVVCGPRTGLSYQVEPAVVFEVLSDSTERQDRGEKREAYLALPSLQIYVLLAQNRTAVEIWRRTDGGWQGEALNAESDILDLPAIGCAIPLHEIYRRALP